MGKAFDYLADKAVGQGIALLAPWFTVTRQEELHISRHAEN
jgi:hypothetical protein